VISKTLFTVKSPLGLLTEKVLSKHFLEKSVSKKYTFYRKNAYGVLKKCLKMFFLFNVFLIKLFSKKFKII